MEERVNTGFGEGFLWPAGVELGPRGGSAPADSPDASAADVAPLQTSPVLAASLVNIARRCGRPGCHCMQGTLHVGPRGGPGVDRGASPAAAIDAGDHAAHAGADSRTRDGAEATGGARLAALSQAFHWTIRHIWPEFSRWLDVLPDTRCAPRIEYASRFLVWWACCSFAASWGAGGSSTSTCAMGGRSCWRM